MHAPVFFNRPLTIGDLLDWTFRIYRARFGKLILITAIFFVPIGLLSALITGQTMTGYLNIFMTLLQNPDVVADDQMFAALQNNEGALVGLSCLLAPISLALTGLVSLALTHQALTTVHNNEATIKQSIQEGWRRFWQWLGMYLISLIAYAGVTMVLGMLILMIFFGLAFAVGSAGAFNSNPLSGAPEAVVVTGMILGLICFYGLLFALIFGPFLYLYTRWTVAVPGIVDQGWDAVEALKQSWALTKGNVWRCFGYNLLLYLFYSVIYGSLMALGFGAAALVITSAAWASVAVFALVSSLLPILWQPIQSAAHAMLYLDLRMRNESYDLEMRITQLEEELGRDAPAAL
ncbi:MAG: glycerophosphoryl diester phosphodiesterase membrane domain-containing protein [Caldilineaceae bacterium]